jgi:endoribonuclease Dicer
MHRIDDILLVKQLNFRFFNNSISEDLLLAALCPRSAGVEFDYERLELLGEIHSVAHRRCDPTIFPGDAFLKFLASVYVLTDAPGHGEGNLHSARQQIISNKALLFAANTAGLCPYIRGKPFIAKGWMPSNFMEQSLASQRAAKVQGYQTDSIPASAHSDQIVGMVTQKTQSREQQLQWLSDKVGGAASKITLI